MKSYKLKITLIVSLLLNLSVIGAAGYQYFKQTQYWTSPFGHKMKKDSFLFEELSLKPEQAGEMRGKAMLFRAEVDRERLAIAQKRKELINLLRAEKPDTKAIGSVISGISRMQEEMQRKITIHMLEQKGLLDKEQQKKFFDLVENAMTEGRQAGCPPTERH